MYFQLKSLREFTNLSFNILVEQILRDIYLLKMITAILSVITFVSKSYIKFPISQESLYKCGLYLIYNFWLLSYTYIMIGEDASKMWQSCLKRMNMV